MYLQANDSYNLFWVQTSPLRKILIKEENEILVLGRRVKKQCERAGDLQCLRAHLDRCMHDASRTSSVPWNCPIGPDSKLAHPLPVL